MLTSCTLPPGASRRILRRASASLIPLLAVLAALAPAGSARAQTGRARITVLEYEGSACRQAAARAGVDRDRGWYCFRGLVRHPAGVAEVLVQGAPADLRADTSGATLFTAFPAMRDEGGDIAIVVRATNGEVSEGGYRLTPAAPNPAYPDLRQFSLTNLRPRLLGTGDDSYVPPPSASGAMVSVPPTAAQAAAQVAAAQTAPGQAAPGAEGTDSTGAALTTMAAVPAVIEDPANQYIQIQEPREWSGVAGAQGRGLRVPTRRSVRVTGYASHPGGVASVLVDGREAAIRQENPGSYRFVGYVPVDSVTREVVVMVRGRSGNPVIGRYQLSGVPVAAAFASRDEAWSPGSGFKGRRWAVVVGISAYQDTTIQTLQYADDDARAMYDFLRSPAAGLNGYAEENIRLLLNQDATASELRSALYTFLRAATEDDHILVYFAGHGAPDYPARPSDLYLLTYDARRADLAATALPMRELDRAVEDLRVGHAVVITDACHSGGITTRVSGVRTGNEVNNINDVFLQQLSSTTGGLAVFAASGADQLSLEDEKWGGGHGVFTHYLLEALEGAADDNFDQIVTLDEMMLYTLEQVRRETGNRQIPIISSSHTYDRDLPMSIVLNEEERATLAVARPPAPAPTTGPSTPAKPTISPALADSLQIARGAVNMFPRSGPYRSRLGRLMLRAEMPDSALLAFREAVRLEPETADFRLDLAMALRDGGDPAASLPHFEEALRLDAQNARYHHEYGGALLALERVDDAIGTFRRAVRLDDTAPAYHASLGQALRLSGRTRDAVTSLRTAVERDGESPVYRRELALTLSADGKVPEAIQEMQAAIATDSTNAAYQVDLAALHRSVSDGAAARAAMERAVRLDSANAEYRSALAELLVNLGLHYEAILEMRAAVRLDSASARYRYQHGVLLTHSDQAYQALAELRAAVRLAPGEASYRNGLGLALRAAGHPGEALTELLQATRLEPGNARYQYDLGTLYTETGEHGDALVRLEQAARLEPDNREYATAVREARRRVPR